jgi:hypothetical protein
MDERVEIALFAFAQIGALIWLLSAQNTKLANLANWVESIDRRSQNTAMLAAELKGEHEALHRL